MRPKKKYTTSYLFPRTSFVIGIGSVASIWGNYYRFNRYRSETESDLKALENDWHVIGNDMKTVLERERKP